MMGCPACGRPTPHRVRYRKNGCAILSCPACGLGRTEVSRFDPSTYYTDAYFGGGHPDGYADYVGAEAVLRREFAHAVRFVRRFRAGGRLLELGCAYGFFLQEAKHYFEVAGIELAEGPAAHCRSAGLDVRTGAPSAALLRPLGTMDVIVLLDVIEHLPDPRATLELCARSLRPGGIIVITTGDFGSWPARLAGPRWRLMTPPQHLWFFTIGSMQRMAASLGLTMEHAGHPWKTVPLSLVTFQLARIMGRPARAVGTSRLGIPLNLFDAMRVVLRKAA